MNQQADKTDGGAAFPKAGLDPWGKAQTVQIGMTLRDYFAAKADMTVYNPFSTLEEKLGRRPTVGELADYISQVRYAEADAMLEARAK